MAISKTDQDVLRDEIVDLLANSIGREYLDVYAATVSQLNRIPSGVVQELHSAIIHLSRAASEKDDAGHARNNLDICRAHIRRASNDCLKLSMSSADEEISSIILKLELARGAVPPEVIADFDDLKRRRLNLLRRAARGNESINDYIRMYLDVDGFREKLSDLYNLTTASLSRPQVRAIRLRRSIGSMALGVGIGVIASLMFTVLVPNQQAFGARVRSSLGLEKKLVQQEAPSNPSQPR